MTSGTTKPDERLLLSPAEVEARYGIPKSTQAWWRTRGEGGPKFLRIGHRIKYRPADVDEWIEEQNQ